MRVNLTHRWWFAAGVSAAITGTAGIVATSIGAPSLTAATIALAFVPYAPLLAVRLDPRRSVVVWTLILAAGAGLSLVLAPPLLSDDVYRFLWDGRVSGAGFDPYRFSPDDPHLAHLRDGYWERINHPSIATIYPPVAQALFWLADLCGHSTLPFRLIALSGHLLTTAVLGRYGPSARAAVLFGLNPLALSESALGGHIDVWAGLAVLASLLCLQNRRVLFTAVSVLVGVGIKLFAVLLVPVFFRRHRVAAIATLFGAALLAWPAVTAGYGSARLGGFSHYARRWQGNEGGFAVVSSLSSGAVATYAWLDDSPEGVIQLLFLEPALDAVRGTPLDPWRGLIAEKKAVDDRTVFDREVVVSHSARVLVLLGIVAFAVVLARRRDAWSAAWWTLLGALLFAPQLHPWYLLWLLPLEAMMGRRVGIVWSAAVLVAYAPLDQWLALRQWEEPEVARALEYGIVIAALVADRVPWRGGGEGGVVDEAVADSGVGVSECSESAIG